MDFFVLLLLSVPVFYILGWIYAIKLLRQDKSTQGQRVTFLKSILPDLKKQPQEATVAQLVEHYELELQKLMGPKKYVPIAPSPVTASAVSQVSTPKVVSAVAPAPVLSKASVSNWYSENSINVLLYVGAFLVVASASIFVGFQWGVISGFAKSSFLTLMALGFLVAGYAFFRSPKVRTAGNVFLAVFALLIPFCGSAWHRFVLAEMGVPFSHVWIATSVVSLIVYLSLLSLVKKSFYTYIASLSTVSMVLGMVDASGADSLFFILGGIISGSLLLVARILAKKRSASVNLITDPLLYSSNFVTAIALFVGFVHVVINSNFYSFDTALALLSGALFYLLSYIDSKKPGFLVPVLILSTLSWWFWLGALGLKENVYLYIVSLAAYVDLLLATYLHLFRSGKEAEVRTIAFVGMGKLIVMFLSATGAGHEHALALSAFLAFGFVPFALIYKNIRALLGSVVLMEVFAFIYITEFTSFDVSFLSYIYALLGIGAYLLYIRYKDISAPRDLYLISTILLFVPAQMFALNEEEVMLRILLAISLVLYHAYFVLKKYYLVYAANFYLFVTSLVAFKVADIEPDLYLFVYLLVAMVFFAFSFIRKLNLSKEMRLSSYAVLLLGILVGNQHIGSDKIPEILSIYVSLTSALFLFIDWYDSKQGYKGYSSSALGMFTYIRLLMYFKVDELLIYTISLGIYFIVLSYLRKRAGDISKYELLEYAGLFFMVAPTTLKGISENDLGYVILLILTGALGIFGGIQYKLKRYTYSGIFMLAFWALVKTYSYIATLPKWAVTGLIGMFFMSIAVYLLSSRKDTHH